MLTRQDIEQIKRDADKLTRRRFEDAQEEGAFRPTATPETQTVVKEEETKHVLGEDTSGNDDEVAKLRAQLEKVEAENEELKSSKKQTRTAKSESKESSDQPQGTPAKQPEEGKPESAESDNPKGMKQHRSEGGRAS